MYLNKNKAYFTIEMEKIFVFCIKKWLYFEIKRYMLQK